MSRQREAISWHRPIKLGQIGSREQTISGVMSAAITARSRHQGQTRHDQSGYTIKVLVSYPADPYQRIRSPARWLDLAVGRSETHAGNAKQHERSVHYPFSKERERERERERGGGGGLTSVSLNTENGGFSLI